MNFLKPVLNSVNHSRLTKSLKKSLVSQGLCVSHSQVNEAVSHIAGFPNFHAAQKFYNDSQVNNKSSNDYVVSVKYRVKLEEDTFYSTKNFLFKGYTDKNKNIYEISKVISFFGYISDNKEESENLSLFLESIIDFFPNNGEEEDEEYLDIDFFNIFSHNEYSQNLDKAFAWDEKFIKSFDDIFAKTHCFEIEEYNFTIFVDEIEILEANQSDIDFMVKNDLINVTIEKDLTPLSFS